MRYYVHLFSPETAKAFADSPRDVSGFRISRKKYVENQKIGPGDKFICYVARIQRFIGVLEIQSNFYIESKPIFTTENDPFALRFKVRPLVWLPLEKSIPIHINDLWNSLSFTKGLKHDSIKWTHMVRSSPWLWPEEDCKVIEKILLEQLKNQKDYNFTEEELIKLKPQKIRLSDKKEIIVSVPEEEIGEIESTKDDARKAIIIQAKLAEVGEKLGFKVWLPNSDRVKVLSIWKPANEDTLLNELPLVFDETTLKTIRNIDVLWIRKRSIVRAFEVEDTTSIYSGILRMADLLALQPMLDIKIHIVAPSERREAVFKQITRPVFSLIGERPLSEVCSYISYDSIMKLVEEEKLKYMNDMILDEYLEFSEE